MTSDRLQEGATASGLRQREKEQRWAERGNHILDALATLITRWGYGKTTVDDIAREAGVAKGTVYLHWPTKGAMLQALMEREEQQWYADLVARMATDPRGGTISSLYRHALVLSAQSPLLRALLTRDHEALGEWMRSPEIRARAHQDAEARQALIREMRAVGLMRTDISVDVQAYLITALTYGILTVDDYMPADLVPPFEEIAAAFAVIVQRGFEPEMPDRATLARGRTVIAALGRSLAGTAASGDALEDGGAVAPTREKEDTL